MRTIIFLSSLLILSCSRGERLSKEELSFVPFKEGDVIVVSFGEEDCSDTLEVLRVTEVYSPRDGFSSKKFESRIWYVESKVTSFKFDFISLHAYTSPGISVTIKYRYHTNDCSFEGIYEFGLDMDTIVDSNLHFSRYDENFGNLSDGSKPSTEHFFLSLKEGPILWVNKRNDTIRFHRLNSLDSR